MMKGPSAEQGRFDRLIALRSHANPCAVARQARVAHMQILAST